MSISSRSIMKVLALTWLFVGAVFVANLVRRELVWIGSAFFLAVAFNPAVGYVARYMPRKSRGLATGLVFAFALLTLAGVAALFVPPLVSQSGQLASNLPGYTEQLVNGHSWVSDQARSFHLVERIKQSQDQLVAYVSAAGGSFFVFLRNVFSSFAAGLTIIGLTFFMLMEGPVWVENTWKLVSPKHRAHWRNLVQEMYQAVTGYVSGNLLTSLLAAVATGLMLVVVHVPYAIPLGILVGLFDLLPLVGATLGAVIVVVAALFTSVAAAIAMVIFFVVYQQVENHVLQPVVYGRTVKMSPLAVLVSVLIGAGLGGILGALVAIPVGASVQILVRNYIEIQATARRS
ncbi:MAG TPA: AI-2E family transporter [Candidatus Saccharimonadia bacterium]